MSQTQIFDISGGIQTATTWLLRQPNEVYDSENIRYDRELGSGERRLGYSLYKALATNKSPLGFFEAKFVNGVKIFYAFNNSGNTNTVLSCYNPDTDTITAVKSDYPPNCKLQMVMNAGELYVAGITTDTGARQTIINIQKDLTVSNYRNLFTSPKAAFIGENSGALYAMNVEVDGVVHPDRAYISSPQRGAITYVNAAMNNTYAPVDLVNQIPLMTSNTAPTGVAAASTINSATYDAFHAFDRSLVRTGGTWITQSTVNTGWISYDFGSGNSKVINFYSLTPVPASPDANDADAAPKDWTFEGSNDNVSWTVLHTVSGAPAWTSQEKRTYKTSNTTAYRYYRVNVSANQGYSDFMILSEVGMLSSLQTTQELQLKLDSARYVKVGMEIDIYRAGTDEKMYTIIPTSVDKSKDTINFLPYNLTISAVNATTNTVTVSSSTLFPTATPILIHSTGGMPGGLVDGTTYYAINDGTNDLKLAVTAADARIGAAIDITTTGSGTMTLYLSYIIAKTDELWLKNRHGDGTPSLFWNTDYRSPQTADFIFIAAGKVADTAITGWAKTNNRINIFTKTSMWQYDNANFLPVFEDIGCISHDTICNNATFIIWLDATGKVRARDSSSGQDQIISRPLKNKYLDFLSSSNLLNASAVMYDSCYKLDVGILDSKYTRFIYNFDMNVWWREAHKRRHVYGLNSSISGTRKSYFLDENGNMFLDEDTNLDWTATIPWFIQWGRRNFGVSALKSIQGLYVYGKNVASSTFMIKKSGKDMPWVTFGQLTEPITSIPIPDSNPLESRDFDFKVSGNSKGEAARIEGIEVWTHGQQTNFSS